MRGSRTIRWRVIRAAADTGMSETEYWVGALAAHSRRAGQGCGGPPRPVMLEATGSTKFGSGFPWSLVEAGVRGRGALDALGCRSWEPNPVSIQWLCVAPVFVWA
jgi:hypothetical protein